MSRVPVCASAAAKDAPLSHMVAEIPGWVRSLGGRLLEGLGSWGDPAPPLSEARVQPGWWLDSGGELGCEGVGEGRPSSFPFMPLSAYTVHTRSPYTCADSLGFQWVKEAAIATKEPQPHSLGSELPPRVASPSPSVCVCLCNLTHFEFLTNFFSNGISK